MFFLLHLKNGLIIVIFRFLKNSMSFYKRSLRNRIFLSMLFLVIGASILIALVTTYQYKEEAEDYHNERLRRKEVSIKKQINYVLKNTTYQEITEKIPLIFKNKIFEIKEINNLELSFYNFKGELLLTSKTSFSPIISSIIEFNRGT